MHNQTFSEQSSYLIYQIGDQFFASNSNEIRNILDIDFADSIKNMQDQINLGNAAIPLYRLGSFEKDNSGKECVVIMETSGTEKKKAAIIVSEIKKLVDINKRDLINKSYLGINYNNSFIEDYVKIDNKLVGIVNLKKILRSHRLRERHVL